MSAPPAPVDRDARLSRSCLQGAFWLPLAVCTYLALTPSPPEAVFRVSDIVLHAFAFSYLTFAMGLAYPRTGGPAMVAWMLGYGVFIEVAQSFEPTRDAELKDLFVDGAGIAVGLVLIAVLGDWSRRVLRGLVARVTHE